MVSEPINSEFMKTLGFTGKETEDSMPWSGEWEYESRENVHRTSLRIRISGESVYVWKVDRKGWFGVTQTFMESFKHMPRQDLLDLCRILSIPTTKPNA